MIQAMYVGSLTIIEAIAYVVVGCASVVGDVSIKRRILLYCILFHLVVGKCSSIGVIIRVDRRLDFSVWWR